MSGIRRQRAAIVQLSRGPPGTWCGGGVCDRRFSLTPTSRGSAQAPRSSPAGRGGQLAGRGRFRSGRPRRIDPRRHPGNRSACRWRPRQSDRVLFALRNGRGSVGVLSLSGHCTEISVGRLMPSLRAPRRAVDCGPVIDYCAARGTVYLFLDGSENGSDVDS